MRNDPWWRRYWRSLGFGPEVAAELQFHLDLLTKDLIAKGMDPAAAAAEASRRFGDKRRVQADLEQIERSRGRRLRFGLWLSELLADIRYGARVLFKRPGFTAAAALSLGLGISTATVVLTVVDKWMLRPIAVDHPNELMVMGATTKAFPGFAVPTIPLPAIRELDTRKDLFEAVGAWRIRDLGLRVGGGKSELSFFLATTGNYFDLIHVRPALGRTYSEADSRDRQRVIVINNSFWRRRLGADPNVVGTTVALNGLPFTVIGVGPPSFEGTEMILGIDGYLPVGAERDLSTTPTNDETDWVAGGYEAIARRRPGQSVERVRTGIDALVSGMRAAHPELPSDFRIIAYSELGARPTISVATMFPVAASILGVLAALVLGVATVNVANLILARASTRTAELSVRLAMGASRARLIRQLLTESALLGILGLGVAVVLATIAVRAMNGAPKIGNVPLRFDMSLDGRVLAMSAAIAILAGMLSGVGPALVASRGELQQKLRRAGRSGGGGPGRGFRSFLVAAQVAVALVALIGAGLFVQSARHAAELDLGFDPRLVMTTTVNGGHSRYTAATAAPVFERVVQAVRQLPGVTAADWIEGTPLTGSAGKFRDVFLGTTDQQTDKRGAVAGVTSTVGADYFAVARMHLLAGRLFTIRDDSTAHRVAVVSSKAAKDFWPGRDPLGQRFRLEAAGPEIEVIGVVNDSRVVTIFEAPRPVAYLPWSQAGGAMSTLVVRMASKDPGAAARIREVFASVDPQLTPYGFGWFDDIVHDSPNGLMTVRLGAQLVAAIGILALILTIVGLYGVLSFAVTQETREIGVRMALGAEPRSIIRRVLVRGGRVVGMGMLAGLLLAIAATRLAGGLLVGVSPNDFGTFAGVAVGLALIALVAALLPARRAARLDPVQALRADS